MTNVHGGPTVSKLTPRYPARRFKDRHLPSSLWKTKARCPHMLFLMQYMRHVRKRCSGNETMSSSHSGFGSDATWSRRFELDQTLQASSRSSKAVNKHSPAAASFSASCLRKNHLPSGVSARCAVSNFVLVFSAALYFAYAPVGCGGAACTKSVHACADRQTRESDRIYKRVEGVLNP
jgi:hypothetical protein